MELQRKLCTAARCQSVPTSATSGDTHQVSSLQPVAHTWKYHDDSQLLLLCMKHASPRMQQPTEQAGAFLFPCQCVTSWGWTGWIQINRRVDSFCVYFQSGNIYSLSSTSCLLFSSPSTGTLNTNLLKAGILRDGLKRLLHHQTELEF